MDHLPPRLLDMPSVKTVNGWYGASLTDLHSFKGLQPSADVVQRYVPQNGSQRSAACSRFTETLQNIRTRHNTVVETLAQVSRWHG